MKKAITQCYRKLLLVALPIVLAFISTQVLAQSTPLTPANGTTLLVEGSATTTVPVTWTSDQPGPNTTNYDWELYDTSGTLLTSINTNDTSIDVSLGAIDNILANAGAAIGDTIPTYWQIVSRDPIFTGSNTSTQQDLNLVRGNVLNAFNLLNPADGTSLTVRGAGNQTVTIDWESAGSGASYDWNLYLQNSTTPLTTIPTGTDTFLVVDFETLDGLLDQFGITVGTTANLAWDVTASAGSATVNSDSVYDINLTRDTVLNSFNLLSPPNGFSATIDGDASNVVVASWQSSYPSGVTYEWYLDVAGNNFSNPVVTVPSDNNGTDTNLTLDFGTIDAVLNGAGVPIGGTANLIWRVKVFGAGDSLWSDSTFALDLTRGTVLNSFSLLAPPSGSLVTIQGNENNEIDITWEQAGDGAANYWQVDLQGGNFSNPIATIPANGAGSDTMLTLSVGAIDNLLATNGVNVGDTAFLSWQVFAVAGTDTVFSNSPFDINLIRGEVLNNFSLLSPPNNFIAPIQGNATNTVDISWQQSSANAMYTWYLDLAGGNFSNPIVSVPANSNGMDTMLTLDFATIDAVLNGANVSVGDTAQLSWTVRSFIAGDSLEAQNSFGLSLIRGNLLNAYDLVAPTNGFAATIEGLASNQVAINWNSASSQASYTWQLDAQGNNFSNPIVEVPSSNNGLDTSLTLDFGTIDAVLAGAGVSIGNTANLIWRVRAITGGDTLYSTSTYNIDLTRGSVLDNFDLISPPDGFTATITGAGSQVVGINWSESVAGATYYWSLDAQGNNFSNPIVTVPSNNMGMDTSLVLDFATIDAVLASAGVTPGNTANLIWKVDAVAGTDTLASDSVFDLVLTRGNVITDFNLLSPASGAQVPVDGPAQTPVEISWSSSSNGVMYQWYAGLRGDNFNTIVVGPLDSDNLGMDTTLTLDMGTLDAVLTGANNVGAVFNIGDTAKLDWTVRAISGTDTVVSSDVFEIDLIRGEVFEDFDLIAPADNFTGSIEGDADTEITITWEELSGAATYSWVLFNNGSEVISVPSGNMGMDTSLTLDFATIDAVLAGEGLSIGDPAATLTWDVVATVANETYTAANGPFNISLARGVLFGGFDLIGPPSNTTLTVAGAASAEINVSWTNAQANGFGDLTYTWELDVLGNGFTNPLASLPADNNGIDTTITLTVGAVNDILVSAGLNPGDSVTTIWRVRASNPSNTALEDTSESVFTLGLIRGIISSTPTITAASDVKIYPNPTNGSLWVEFPENVANATIQVFDISGKNVFVQQLNEANKAFIDMESQDNLKPGLYLVRVKAGNFTTTKRVVVK